MQKGVGAHDPRPRPRSAAGITSVAPEEKAGTAAVVGEVVAGARRVGVFKVGRKGNISFEDLPGALGYASRTNVQDLEDIVEVQQSLK